jgi:hypothetical protein
MTKKERAQVVELLRCAADCCGRRFKGEWSGPFHIAARSFSTATYWAAWRARDGIKRSRLTTEQYRRGLLEAAARVEEGSYP